MSEEYRKSWRFIALIEFIILVGLLVFIAIRVNQIQSFDSNAKTNQYLKKIISQDAEHYENVEKYQDWDKSTY